MPICSEAGTVDLIAFGTAASGYVPIAPGGGFDRPVQLTQTPPVSSAGLASRFVDLDGDGRTDVLTVTDEFFACYYRENGGFDGRPQTIPRADAPEADIRDPHVKLADMTGDGLQDLVRVDGASIRYWPYLGYGQWADPVVMANAPSCHATTIRRGCTSSTSTATAARISSTSTKAA